MFFLQVWLASGVFYCCPMWKYCVLCQLNMVIIQWEVWLHSVKSRIFTWKIGLYVYVTMYSERFFIIYFSYSVMKSCMSAVIVVISRIAMFRLISDPKGII